MGKRFGTGKTTDIHKGPNLEFLQEGKKIRYGPVGMSDGENFNHSGLDSPQLAAFVIPAEAGIQFFLSGFPPTWE